MIDTPSDKHQDQMNMAHQNEIIMAVSTQINPAQVATFNDMFSNAIENVVTRDDQADFEYTLHEVFGFELDEANELFKRYWAIGPRERFDINDWVAAFGIAVRKLGV